MSSSSSWMAGEVLGHVVEVLGVADARHHVLALGVHQEVAVGPVLAGGGVAGEAHAGAGVVVAVAEHHGLHVHGGAEIVADLLAHPVRDGAGAVPRLEHGLDRAAELQARALRERLAGGLLHDRQVGLAEGLEHRGREVGVVRGAGLLLGGLERVLEEGAVDAEHDAPVHRDEAAVRVVREALVAGDRGEALHALVVEAEVEDRVHHARHRELGARAHRHQQRVVRVAELATHRLLELEHVVGDLVVETCRPAAVHVRTAGVGRDRETRRHRQAEHRGHLGEVRTLATQQILVGHGGLAVLVIEGVDVLHGGKVYGRPARLPRLPAPEPPVQLTRCSGCSGST